MLLRWGWRTIFLFTVYLDVVTSDLHAPQTLKGFVDFTLGEQ